MTEITEPGVYDLPHDEYHVDPVPWGSLSQSGAKLLLPPNCPAKFKHQRDHGRKPTKAFDVGQAAHKYVLGKGNEIVVVEADDWRTKAARKARDEAHADGNIPLLEHEHEQVLAMVAALEAHPLAAALFSNGQPEQSLFWRDGDIWRRARLDWLPEQRADGRRLIVPDYKTTDSAAPDGLTPIMWRYRYVMQAGWYLDGLTELGLADENAVFAFVFQEKDPPYLVTVAELDAPALRIGRLLNQQAIDIYRECIETDTWPGYSTDVELISVPRWVENQYLEGAVL